MKQMNDVEILFDAINENPDTYQEIVQHQEVMKSLERWPLIAAINQVTPLEAPTPRAAVSIFSSPKALEPKPKAIVLEAIFIEEVLIEKPSIDIYDELNEIAAKPFADENIAAPAIEVKEKISEFALNSRSNNRAASENISSMFERLKRS